MRSVRIAAVLTCCVLALGLGCKKKGATPEAGASAVKAVKIPDAPDKFMQTGLDALKANKPVEVYALLPDSYRKDIQGLVSAVTTQLDKEVFELGVQVLDEAMVCLDKHGDKIAGLAKGAPFDVKKALEQTKKFYGLLKDMGLLKYDTVRSLDVAGFLAAHGEKLMKALRNAGKTFQGDEMSELDKTLASVTFKTKEAKGDKATLEVTADGHTETFELKKVDGRWVPVDMDKGWARETKDLRKEIDGSMKEFAANKEQIKAALTQTLAALKKFEGSGNPADLMALGGLMKM